MRAQPTTKQLIEMLYERIPELFDRPQQEPVAWGVDWGHNGDRSCVSIMKKNSNGIFEVVAIEYDTKPSLPQRPWVGLTDEERTAIRRETYALPLLLIDAIEAKLKEKNSHD